MIKSEFIHFHSTGMNPCSLDKNAYAKAKETWLCLGCGAPKPLFGSIDVQIQENCPIDTPLTFVSGCGVALAHRDFVEALGLDHVHADLMLGAVYGPSGSLIPDWLTIRGRYRLIVRGSKNVSYRNCESCGRHIYFAMGTRYLFPAPPAGLSIYESDLFGIVVIPELLEGLSLARWPKLGIEKLKVPSQPKDGMGDLR